MAANKAILGEVRAHKAILALRAPVFLRQFLGEFPSPLLELHVEDTSLTAFETLIRHIYKAEDDWTSLSLPDVFEVAGLADKYLLPRLMDKATAHLLLDVKISDENLFEAAEVAEDFCLLTRASSALLDHCAMVIKENLVKSPFYVVDLAKRTSPEQAQLMQKLLARVANCSSCGAEECQDGKMVRDKSELVVGARLKTIRPNWRAQFFKPEMGKGEIGEKCTVTSLGLEDGQEDDEEIVAEFDDGLWNVYVCSLQEMNLVFNCNAL